MTFVVGAVEVSPVPTVREGNVASEKGRHWKYGRGDQSGTHGHRCICSDIGNQSDRQLAGTLGIGALAKGLPANMRNPCGKAMTLESSGCCYD